MFYEYCLFVSLNLCMFALLNIFTSNNLIIPIKLFQENNNIELIIGREVITKIKTTCEDDV